MNDRKSRRRSRLHLHRSWVVRISLAADETPEWGTHDSFCLVHIAVFIELTFGVVIPDVELTVENCDTLAQLAARVAAG